jgi:integrase
MLVQKSPFIVVAEPNTKPHFKIVNRTGRADKDVLSFLLDLLASDRSPETIKSYAFGLCAWFNFLHSRTKSWQTARSQDLRDYVLHLRDANNPYRVRRRPNSPEPGSANLQTGKPSLGPGYKLSTINHRLSVIQSFYDFQHHAGTIASDIARLDRPRIGHHNPLEPWPLRRRGPYRQRTQKRVPRGLSDALWDNIFDNLQCDRDRAILCLLTSSGSRAQELLNMKGADIDWGGQRVQLICKGTRQENWVGASPEFFRWLAAYLTKRSQLTAKSPLWVTLRKPERSMKYTALRAIFTRINHKIGTNVTAHDFRHTCALRLAADPKISLVDIQTHLRHRHITTTERYLVAHPDEVIKRLQAHQAKKPLPKISNNTWKYDSADLGLLLGKEGANQ